MNTAKLVFMRPFFSVVLFFFCVQALGSESLKAAVMDKPPFGWEENDKRQGFHFDVAEAIGVKSGYKSEVQLAPVMRIIEMLRSQDVDFIILTEYQELDEMKVQKELLLDVTSSIFSLKSKPIRSREEAKNTTVARLGRGCAGLNDETGIQWQDVQSYEQAYNLLKAGRVQGVCSTTAFWHVVEKNKARKEIYDFQVSRKTVWVQSLPGTDQKKWKKVQTAVRSLIKDGTVERLAEKYLKAGK